MPTILNEYGLKPGELDVNLLIHADEFQEDIYKNLRRWRPRGQSVFYLTDDYWYHFRMTGAMSNCVRHNLKTHRVTSGLAFTNRLKIGKSFLTEPAQSIKRVEIFFKFIADIRGR